MQYRDALFLEKGENCYKLLMKEVLIAANEGKDMYSCTHFLQKYPDCREVFNLPISQDRLREEFPKLIRYNSCAPILRW